MKLFPGVRLNFSKTGVSLIAGRPGLMFNVGPRGSSVTVGPPGTDLSYKHQFPKVDARRPSPVPAPRIEETAPAPETVPAPKQGRLVGEIKSEEVATLTSPDLAGLKQMINEVVHQRRSLQPDVDRALAERAKAWRTLRRAEQFPLRPLMRFRLDGLRSTFVEAESSALEAHQALATSRLSIRYGLGEAARAAWRALAGAHGSLSHVSCIWDVTGIVTGTLTV